LDLEKLSPAEQALFTSARRAGQVEKTLPTLPEPHGSWVKPLASAWAQRYGQ